MIFNVSIIFCLLADGYPATAGTCSAVIRSCDGSRWREQLDLLQEMRRRGLQPNAAALNAAVCRCSEAGQWRSALQLMSNMWERGLQPDVAQLNIFWPLKPRNYCNFHVSQLSMACTCATVVLHMWFFVASFSFTHFFFSHQGQRFSRSDLCLWKMRRIRGGE